MIDAPPPDEAIPPQDLDAERQVLAAWLTSPRAIDDCEGTVSPGDFYRPLHETIAAACLDLRSAGEPVDSVTVGDRLGAGLLRWGGTAVLHEIVQSLVTAANAAYHAEIVAAHASRRRLEDVAQSILTSTRASDVDPTDLIEQARAALDAAAERAATRHAASTSTDVYAAIEALDAEPGIPTPWRDLTAALGGWRRGAVYFVGARPGKGKSVVGMCAALDAARRGYHALIASLEMSRTEIYQRMLCHVGSVDGTRMMRRTLTKADYESLSSAAGHIAALPITVIDDAAQRVVDIRAAARSASRVHPLGLIVVDYLQLMSSGQRVESRQVEVANFSRGLKLLARELDVPVIVLAQLNRGPEQRHDKRPTMGDLRESGSQEQDADAVILLHRDPDGPNPDDLELMLAKHRHGPADLVVRTSWEGRYSRISDHVWARSGAAS